MVKKIIILLLLTVVAVGLIFYFRLATEEEITPQAGTGNIDDAVNALLAEIDDEQLTLGGAEDDKSLIFSDNQEAGAFSQSADENEL